MHGFVKQTSELVRHWLHELLECLGVQPVAPAVRVLSVVPQAFLQVLISTRLRIWYLAIMDSIVEPVVRFGIFFHDYEASGRMRRTWFRLKHSSWLPRLRRVDSEPFINLIKKSSIEGLGAGQSAEWARMSIVVLLRC